MSEHLARLVGALRGLAERTVVPVVDRVLCRWRMKQAMEFRQFAAQLDAGTDGRYKTTVDRYNAMAEEIETRCHPGR